MKKNDNVPVIDSVSQAFKKDFKDVKPEELTPEQKLELERKALGPSNYNRKMRRDYLRRAGVLKMKNKMNFGSEEFCDWYKKTHEEGKKIHQENTDAVNKQKEWYLEQIDKNTREHLTEFYTNAGWSEAAINDEVAKQMDLWYTEIFERKNTIEQKDYKRKN